MIRQIQYRRHRQKGFTLIEALIALSIAAITLLGFYDSLATNALLKNKAKSQASRVQIATQILDRVGYGVPLAIGAQQTGVIDGHRWRVNVSDRATPDMQLGRVDVRDLMFVYVSVWPEDAPANRVNLRAIRYAETPL